MQARCIHTVNVRRVDIMRSDSMHEFGNYLGTQELAAVPLEVDEEYEAYLDTLNLEELKDEAANLKALMDAYDKMES